jgi:hypothetical protein
MQPSGRPSTTEGATAVAGHSAIGVDDDLPSGQSGVAVRSSDHETPGGIHQKLGPGMVKTRVFQNRADHLFDHGLPDGAVCQLPGAVALGVLR